MAAILQKDRSASLHNEVVSRSVRAHSLRGEVSTLWLYGTDELVVGEAVGILGEALR